MGKVFKSVGRFVGPALALSGVGAPLAIAGGALAGGLSGGGLKGALSGALGGATGLGGSLGGALSSGLGLGLGTGAAGALGSGLIGATAGGIGGGLKGALAQGGLSGIGGYIQGSGGFGNAFDNVKGALSGSGAGTSGVTGVGTPGISPVMGGATSSYDIPGLGGVSTASASPVSSSIGGVTASAPTAASTAPSWLEKATSTLGGYQSLSPLLSAGIGTYTNDQTADALQEQQARSEALYSPFLQSKFEPGDLTQDPGYQFQLGQGQAALDRAQSARGNYFSGEALQAAQDYGQGLAGTTYNDAYKRYLQDQQQKLGVAGALTGVYDNIGNINANAITNTGNGIAAGAAGLLGGNGFNNTGQSFNNQNALIQALLARQGAY